MNYKVGDAVLAVRDTSILNAGEVYTVTRAAADRVYVDTRTEFGELDYDLDYFEAVKPATSPEADELDALRGIVKTLEQHSDTSVQRMVSYLADRFDVMI